MPCQKDAELLWSHVYTIQARTCFPVSRISLDFVLCGAWGTNVWARPRRCWLPCGRCCRARIPAWRCYQHSGHTARAVLQYALAHVDVARTSVERHSGGGEGAWPLWVGCRSGGGRGEWCLDWRCSSSGSKAGGRRDRVITPDEYAGVNMWACSYVSHLLSGW